MVDWHLLPGKRQYTRQKSRADILELLFFRDSASLRFPAFVNMTDFSKYGVKSYS